MHGLHFSFPVLRRTACGLLLSPAAVLAQQTLTEVVVTGNRNEAPALDTARRSATASHVDVSMLELPASVSGVSAEQIDERADRGAAEAVTRTVGLSAAGTPGNGGLSFASRGFYGGWRALAPSRWAS